MRRRPVGLAGADLVQARRGLALIRVAAIPVIFVGERLVEHPTLESDPFDFLLVGATVYALGTLALAFSPSPLRVKVPGVVYAVLDLVFICALTYASGGAFSQLRYAFFLLPIGAAFLLSPPFTAGASVVSVAAYVVTSLLHPATRPGRSLEFALTQAVYLTWMSVAAIFISYVLTRRGERIAQLAAGRGRLVAQALDAEDRERRRLAEALHDEAIQNLLAARQELEDRGRGDGAGLARALEGVDRTIEQLRGAVFDLHPYALEHSGLAVALRQVAEQQARRGGYRAIVDVTAEDPGDHDQVIFSVGRELLINAAKHADADHVWLIVKRDGDGTVLEVTDDGRGMEERRQEAAALEGHIGLASSTERIEALGGSFEIVSRPLEGTTVRATIPDGVKLPRR